jgi:hypothetical protein
LVSVSEGVVASGPELAGPQLWLKSVWGWNGLSRYSYSVDGVVFAEFGPPYQLAWGNYRGDRLGLYTYNSRNDLGYVDFAFFRYTYAGAAPTNPLKPR